MVRGCYLGYTFAYPSSKLYVITVSRPKMLVKIFPIFQEVYISKRVAFLKYHENRTTYFIL